MNCRRVPNSGTPLVRFLFLLFWAAGSSITTFGAIVLTFSDPLRDPSFSSKAATCGVVLLCGLVHTVMGVLDTVDYAHLWSNDSKSFQFALQVSSLHALLLCMSFT